MQRSGRSAHAPFVACLFIMALGCSRTSDAQGTATEFWPELEVYWKTADQFRFMGDAALTTGADASCGEGTLGLFLDYLQDTRHVVRAGYRQTQCLAGEARRERRGLVELT